jgi:hypothetical protein
MDEKKEIDTIVVLDNTGTYEARKLNSMHIEYKISD